MDNENCCLTTGGNSTLTNGNEQDTLNRVVMIPARIEGAQDGDFHPAGKPGA